MDAHTARTASASPASPRTPSTVSARPAIETIAPSSHVALDRTAKPHGALSSCACYRALSSSERPSGSVAERISARASAARAYTARPEAALRSERGSHDGESWRTVAENAFWESTHVGGTRNPFFLNQTRRAA